MAAFSDNLQLAVLGERDKKQLADWIGRPCHFEILYKASRHGVSSQTFHKMCDGKGSTVTVLYSCQHDVFGGYLSESWHSNNTFISDNQAFLFELSSNARFCPCKKNIKNPNLAGYGNINFGPTFGGPKLVENYQGFAGYGNSNFGSYSGQFNQANPFGNQQQLPKASSSVQYDLFTLNDNNVHVIVGMGLGNAFGNDDKKLNIESKHAGSVQLTDLEVYLVKYETNFQAAPWRSIPHWDEYTYRSLLDEINRYTPLKRIVSYVNVLLVGQTNAGKSSFFNTVNSIFRGEITARAGAGSLNHSVTSSFRKYRIRDRSGDDFLKFKLCDTRGLEGDMSIHLQDIAMILDGLLPDDYKFNPVAPAKPGSQGVKKSADLEDRIHCVAFVVDGSSISVISDGIKEKFKQIQQNALERGIPQIVYLTKLDLMCPMVDEDIRHLYTSGNCKMALETAAEVMGLPKSHIFPVKNYEKETDLSIPLNILALKALRQTLVFARDYLEEEYDKSEY